VSNTDADDFFSSLMKELKDDVDSSTTRERGTRHHDNAGPNARTKSNDSEDSFFENLMSELGGALEAEGSTAYADTGRDSDDDFFASLEADLTDSLNGGSSPSRPNKNDSDHDDDAFFASLESELSSSLGGSKGRRETKTQTDSDDDFFASLQDEIDGSLGKQESDEASIDHFFSGLMDDVADELEMTQKKSVKVEKALKSSQGDYDSMTVTELKDMLKSRGLKVGGRKAELIERLQSS
jgi:hypothetical protein